MLFPAIDVEILTPDDCPSPPADSADASWAGRALRGVRRLVGRRGSRGVFASKYHQGSRVGLQMHLVTIFLSLPHLNTLVSFSTANRNACGRTPPGYHRRPSERHAEHASMLQANPNPKP